MAGTYLLHLPTNKRSNIKKVNKVAPQNSFSDKIIAGHDCILIHVYLFPSIGLGSIQHRHSDTV